MDYVVFDLETTGLSPERDGIVEIGALRVRGGEVIEDEQFHSLVKPTAEGGQVLSIPWRVSRIHGITDRHVAGAPTMDELLPDFLKFVGDSAVVAHNASFDTGFMRTAAKRAGLLWTPRAELCTMQLSRRAFPGERSHKLDLLAQRLGLEFEEGGRHRSMGDVRVTAQAFVRLMNALQVAAD